MCLELEDGSPRLRCPGCNEGGGRLIPGCGEGPRFVCPCSDDSPLLEVEEDDDSCLWRGAKGAFGSSDRLGLFDIISVPSGCALIRRSAEAVLFSPAALNCFASPRYSSKLSVCLIRGPQQQHAAVELGPDEQTMGGEVKSEIRMEMTNKRYRPFQTCHSPTLLEIGEPSVVGEFDGRLTSSTQKFTTIGHVVLV